MIHITEQRRKINKDSKTVQHEKKIISNHRLLPLDASVSSFFPTIVDQSRSGFADELLGGFISLLSCTTIRSSEG